MLSFSPSFSIALMLIDLSFLGTTPRSRRSPHAGPSLPRRTSLRLAQASSNANDNAGANPQTRNTGANRNGSYTSTLHSSRQLASVEVAIPVNKTRLSSHGSSTPSVVGDTVGDGPNEYNTPATSVAVTPAESDVNTSRKRVSATARARELRSNAMSLSTRRGLKRASEESPAHNPTDASDADLARFLQIQEYQKPVSKRQKVSDCTERDAWDIQVSTDDDDISLVNDESSEWDERDAVKGPQRRRKTRARASARSGTIIADSEDSNSGDDEFDEQDDIYQNDPDPSDSVPSASATEDETLLPQRPRNENIGNASTRRRARARTQAPSSRPSWMSHRVCEHHLLILML